MGHLWGHSQNWGYGAAPPPPPPAGRNNGRSELSATQREKHPKHRKHRRCVTSSTCSLLLSPPCPPFCPPPRSTEGLSPQPPSARPRLSPVSPQWVQRSAAELPPPQRSVWGCGAVSSPPHPHLPVPEGQGWGGLSQSCISPPAPPLSRCSLTFQHRSEGFLLSVGPLWPRGPPPPRRGHEGMALSVCGGSKGSSAPTTGPQRAQSSAGTANPRALLPKRCMGCSTGGGGVHCLHPTAQCSSAPLPRQTKLRSCSCAYSCEHRAAQCSTEQRSTAQSSARFRALQP